MDQIEQNRTAFKALNEGLPDLERLDALSNQFNLFKAVDFTTHELADSKFLAFLLNRQADEDLE